MSRCQRVVQSILACIFTCALLLAFASPRTAVHATSSVSIGKSSCLAPPANFNPLTATKSQVDLYGLPPKPVKQQDLQRWAKLVSSAKHRSCGAPIPRANHYSQPLSARAAGAARARGVTPNFSNSTWTTWSGYATDWGYGSGFDEAYGEWNLPCVYAPDPYGYHSITWVGLGGWFNQPNDNLLQAGTINDPTYGTIASPGGLNSAGDSFTDYWHGIGAGYLC